MQRDIVYSCRVCCTHNQDEYEKLISNNELTPAGQMYEETLGLTIDFSTIACFPQYICNSCELQLKLFKRLKDKARNTLASLEEIFQREVVDQQEEEEEGDKEMYDNACMSIKEEIIDLEKDVPYLDSDWDVEEQITQGLDEMSRNGDLNLKANDIPIDNANYENVFIEFLCDEEVAEANGKTSAAEGDEVFVESNEFVEAELTNNDDDLNSKEDTVQTEIPVENVAGENKFIEVLGENYEEAEEEQVEEQTQSVIEKEQPDQILDETQPELFHEVHTPSAADEDIYLDVDYLELEDKTTSKTKRKYYTTNRCDTCDLVFQRRSQLTHHRQTVHNNRLECPVCLKCFQKSDSLRVHMKLHQGPPAYQCTICLKTFNQKGHYKYHMDGHNNVRKYSCECGKAFLSKSDLNVHKRSHTNDRPYSCELCGKFFFLFQHLKMHKYSHIGKSLSCNICQQKFTSPATLHAHTKTIHSDGAFKCEVCDRPFRRKDHLRAHYRVHKYTNESSNVIVDGDCDEFMEMIEESGVEFNEDEISLWSNGFCVVDDNKNPVTLS